MAQPQRIQCNTIPYKRIEIMEYNKEKSKKTEEKNNPIEINRTQQRRVEYLRIE